MAWDDIFDPHGDGSLVDPMHEELTEEDKLGSEDATESDIEIEALPDSGRGKWEIGVKVEGEEPATEEDPFEAGYEAESQLMESEEMQYKLGESATTSLEDISKNKKIAESLGVPLESVEVDPTGASQKLRAQNSAAILETTPKVKQHLKNQENTLGLAHAAEELSFWELLSDDAKHGWASGELIYDIGILASDSMLAKDPDKQKELLEKAKQMQEILRATPQSESYFGGAGFIGSTAEQVSLMLEILPYVVGTAGVTGVTNALAGLVAGPGGSLGLFGAGATAGGMAATAYQTSKIEEGHAFLEMLEQGIDEETAVNIATTVGAVNGLLELTGAIGWTKPIKDMVLKSFKQEMIKGLKDKTKAVAIKNTLKTWGKAIAFETSTEVAQEVSKMIGVDVGRHLQPGMDPKVYSEEGRSEMGSEIWHILDKTLKSMLLISSPGAALKLRQELKEVNQTENTSRAFKAMGDVSQNSEAMEKLPDEMKQAVEAATKDGPIETVYIQADKFEEYFQDGTTAVAEELGISDQMEDLQMLKEKGGSLEIPVGVYAEKIAMDPEAHTFLGNHSKLNPDHATPAQTKTMDEAVARALEEAEKTIAKVQTDAEAETSSQRVFDKLKSMAVQDKKVTADQATQWATLYEARFIRMAEDESKRTGEKVLPHEMWERYGFDLDIINSPLEITAADFTEKGIPSPQELKDQGYDAIRILKDEKLGETESRFSKDQTLSLRRYEESQQVTAEPQTLDQATDESTAGLDPVEDELVIKARQGDESAQATLKEYGLEWEFEPIVRFVAKGEVDNLLKGGKQQGKFDDGRVDVTKNIEGIDVPATNKDYRIRLKDSFDDKASNSKVQMKNEQDGWLESGYDLNDVATIEERQPDGSWKLVHQAEMAELPADSPDTLNQSAAPLQKKPLKVKGTGKKGQITNWNIAEAFTQRHDKKYGRKLDPIKSEEDYKIVLRELNKEYKDQAKKEDAGADWYIEDINEAVEITKLVIPELADPVKKELFLAIVAFTSPNNAPLNNWEVAIQVMQGYLKNGKIPTKRINKKTGKWTGKNLGVKSLRTGTQLLQKLIDRYGEEGALKWIGKTRSGKEIAQFRKDSGLFTKKRLLSGYVAGETNMSGEWYGAAAMGPKVSEFFLNVAGLNQDALTIDLWAARTYNRLVGRLLDVSAGKKKSKTIVQDLRGKAERDVIKRLFRDLAKKNNVDPSAMQAALWYFEQRLFRNHGATAKSENFSGAATRAAETREISIPRRSEDGERSVRPESLDVQKLFREELNQGTIEGEVSPTWYYSALAEALDTLPENKSQPKTAKEWAQIIKPGMAKGVTKDEIIWTGLEEFLSRQTKQHKIERAQARVNTVKDGLKRFKQRAKDVLPGFEDQYKDQRGQGLAYYEGHLAIMEEGLKRQSEAKKDPKVSLQHIKDYLARRGVRIIDVTETGFDVSEIEDDPAFEEHRNDIMMRLMDDDLDYMVNIAFQEDMDEFGPLHEEVNERINMQVDGRVDEEAVKLLAGGKRDEYADFDAARAAVDNVDSRDKILEEVEADHWEEYKNDVKDENIDSLRETARMKMYEMDKYLEESHEEALETFERDEVTGGKYESTSLPGGEYHELLLTLPDDRFIPTDQATENIKTIQDKLLAWAKERSKEPNLVHAPRHMINRFSDWVHQNRANIDSGAPLSLIQSIHTLEEEKLEDYINVLSREELKLYKSLSYTKYFELFPGGYWGDVHKTPTKYHGSHWDEANVVAHIRFKKRDNVLFIEEFQSDWGKALRNHKTDSYNNQVADGPFVGDTKNWTALAVKRMIAYAMENGYERIEWTSGLQQSGHYQLIEHMDGVKWNPDTKVLSVLKKGQRDFTQVAHSVEAGELPKYIGQEVAARLLKTVETKQQLADDIEMPEPSFDPVYEAYELFEQVPFYNVGSRFPMITHQQDVGDLGVAYTAEMYVLKSDPNTAIRRVREEEPGLGEEYHREYFEQVDASTGNVIQGPFESLADAMIDIAEDLNLFPAQPGTESFSKIHGLLPNDKVLTGLDLEMSDKNMAEYYNKILPNVIKDVLKKMGVKDSGMKPVGTPKAKEYTPGEQPGFDMTPIREALTDQENKTKRIALFQDKRKKGEGNRASFMPGDIFGGEGKSVITLFENRDLSSFLHESGHFYFETLRDMANLPGASEQTIKDMETLLEFASPGMDRDTWNNMSFNERRVAHEKVARAFEVYLFEGKAPSADLKDLFRRFRDWLKAVYKIFTQLNVKLTDDVRNVFDRMLATDEQIETAKATNEFEALFGTEEESGVDPARWAAYQAALAQGDAAAKEKLQARSLQNLKWYEGAKGKHQRRLQREQRAKREDVKSEMLDTFSKQRVYQVITWLRQPVDKIKRVKTDVNNVVPERDSLFEAISKLGGINKQELEDKWLLDPKTKFPTFKPVARAGEDGLSIDEMGILLSQESYAYLPVDENSKYDPDDFEEKFLEELSGRKVYSPKNDRYQAAESLEDEYFKYLVDNDEAMLDMSMKVKLSIPMLEEMFGAGHELEGWKNLPKGRWGLLSEDGTNPKLVADLFEYRTPDKMIREILEAKPLKEAVEEATDARMLELYGDMNTSEQIEQAAIEALHNDLRTKQVHTELSFLTGTGEENIRAKDAREWAKEKVSKTKVRHLKPGKYLAQERRAAKAAMDAIKKGNRKEAIAQQRAVVINHHFAREMAKAAEEAERAIRYFNKFNNKTTRQAIEPEFRDQIDALLEQYDFRVSVTEAELQERKSLNAWINEQEEKGITPIIPENILALTRLKHYRDVPMDELRGLKDAVKNIDHIGRWNNKLRLARDKKNLQDVVNAINASIEEFAPNRPPDLRVSHRLPDDLWGKYRAKYFAEHRKVANIGWLFDGSKYGPFWKSFMRPLNERADWETIENARATEKLGELFDLYSAFDFAPRAMPGGKKDQRLYVRKHFPSMNRDFSKMERIMVGMNWGNETNRTRLMIGFDWNEVQVQEILDTLDERDWSFIMGVWEYIDSYWPDMKAKEERVHGVAPEKVQGMAIETKINGKDVTINADGKLGYFPIIGDEELSGEALIARQKTLMDQAKKGATGAAMTRHGHLKQRKDGEFGSTLRLDFNAITQHVTQVVHDLAWHEVLIDSSKILKHPDFRSKVLAHYGIDIWEQIMNMLNDVALGQQSANTFTERIMGHFRNGVSIAYMGYNVGTAYLQIFGLSQGFERVGTKWVNKGLGQTFTGAVGQEQMMQKVYDMSPFMKHRGDTHMREINDLQNKIGMKGFMSKISEDHIPHVFSHFYLIAKAQQTVDVPIFLGAYERFIEEGVDGVQVDEATAIAMAEQMVIDTQGSGHIKDLAAIQRGGPALKLFTSFISYFQVTFQLYVDALGREGVYGPKSFFKEIAKDPIKLGRLVVDYLLLTTVPVLATFYLKDALIKGECDYGRDLACSAKKIAADHVAYPMSGLIGFREITGALYGGYFADYQGPAGTRVYFEVGQMGKEYLHGEWDTDTDTLLKKAKVANKVGGIVFHYPSGALDKLFFGFHDYMAGKTDNPAAPFFGYSKQ